MDTPLRGLSISYLSSGSVYEHVHVAVTNFSFEIRSEKKVERLSRQSNDDFEENLEGVAYAFLSVGDRTVFSGLPAPVNADAGLHHYPIPAYSDRPKPKY